MLAQRAGAVATLAAAVRAEARRNTLKGSSSEKGQEVSLQLLVPRYAGGC